MGQEILLAAQNSGKHRCAHRRWASDHRCPIPIPQRGGRTHVGGVTLLWNVVGAYDYLMTQTQNEAYMGQFTPEQLEFFYAFPTWVVAFWALAVWGGVLGSILLLMKKSLAVPVFMVSLSSMVITTFQNYVLSDASEVIGAAGIAFSAVIFLIAVALVLYARAMRERGVLT